MWRGVRQGSCVVEVHEVGRGEDGYMDEVEGGRHKRGMDGDEVVVI